MERFKKILNRLLFPGTAVIIMSVPIAAVLLIYTFIYAGENSPIAYVSYVFSAYSLTILCIGIVPAIKKSKKILHKNKHIHRYLTDMLFKAKVSLYGSLGINSLYALFKFVTGVYYSSVWLITLAVYYISLVVVRFLLLRHVNKNTAGENLRSEWRRYRLCGIILMLMNLALGGMVALVVHENRGFEYAGYLIYVMAFYTFYTTVIAVVNIMKYKKLGSPVMSAAKAINLATALVSMLALETAMLSQFGDSDDALFRRIMTGATGGVICVFILGMAVFMIIRSTKQLKKIRENV